MAYISPLDEIKKIAAKLGKSAGSFVTKTIPNAVAKGASSFYDNKGYFQQGKFTTQPLNKPIAQKIVQPAYNFVKPQIQGAWQGLNEPASAPYTNKTSAYSMARGVSGGALTPITAPIQAASRFVSQVPNVIRGMQEVGPVNEIYRQRQANTEKYISTNPRLKNDPVLAEATRVGENFLTMGMTMPMTSLANVKKLPKIKKSDLDELFNSYKVINKPLNPKSKVDLDRFQGALDFMSDLKNNLKIGIDEKRWRSLTPQEQHTTIFNHVKELHKNNPELKLGLQSTPKGGNEAILKAEELKKTNLGSKPIQGKIVEPEGIQTTAKPIQGVSSSPKSITQIENPDNPYFNVNRINVPKETKQAIKTAVEDSKPQIEAVVGKKLSNQEVINFSNTSSKVLHQAVTREQTKQWEAALLKAREQLAAQANKGELTQDFLDNLIAIKSLGTDTARKLQSFGINANPQELSAKQAILEAILKVTDNTDDLLAKAKGVDFNDLNQATNFYRQFVKPKASEWVDLLRYNSMLSSPNTHITNTASNLQGTGLLAPIEKTILGGVDFLRSKATGTERRYLAGEGKEYAKGFYGSLREAAHNFSDVMSGKTFSQNPDLRNIPLTQKGTAGRAVENTLSYPLKLLEAADQFFTTLTKSGVEKSLAYRQSKGIKVANPQAKALAEAQKRLFRGDIGEKGQGVILDAMDEVTNTIFRLRSSSNPIVSTLSKFSLPFVKTPMNILKQGIEYSPVGFANLPKSITKQEQFVKAVMGTAMGIGAANLLASDRLSWAEPSDPDKKSEYRAAGIQPYSVRIGDTWVSYSKVHPVVSMNLAMVAAIRDAEQNGKITDGQGQVILKGLSNWLQFFADQSYVKSIGDMISSTRGDIEGGGRIAANYVQQLVPFRALSGWVARILDPYQRKVNPDAGFVQKQLQQFMTQVPGLSQKVEPRLNATGQPIESQHRLLNAVSPSRISTQDPAKIKDYQEVQKIQKISQQAKYDRDLVKKDAVKVYSTLQKLDPNEAWEKLKELKDVNPQLYTAIKTEAENDKFGLSYKERKIRGLTVEDGTRAKYISDELKKLTSNEEKARLYDDWKKKKIITTQVAGQIKYLIQKGEL